MRIRKIGILRIDEGLVYKNFVEIVIIFRLFFIVNKFRKFDMIIVGL